MGRFFEFAKTLEDQLRKELFPSENTSFQPSSQHVQDDLPSGFAWLLSQKSGTSEEIQAPQVNRARLAYGVRPRPRPDHSFSPSQLLAYAFYANGIEGFPKNYTRAELKAAWRKMALRTHPDQGGSDEIFRKAQKAYLELKTVFSTVKA